MPDPVYRSRLDRFGPHLRRQLHRLYGAQHDVDALCTRASRMLLDCHDDRPDAMLALDAERANDSEWFVRPDMLGYSTYVDRFGGNLAGVAARVAHLEKLGIRYLHLLALLKARDGDSDGGFAVADYLAVQPALGTIADLEGLTARLRASRISLCIDLALNHTADDHRWARAAKAGDPHFRDFYIVVDAATAETRERELHEVFPVSAPGNFTPIPAMGGSVWTTFYPFQWDLNWANPEVFLAMLKTMLRLANFGVEAFRLDSIAFLWKQAGTDSRNLKQAQYIVRALRAALAIAAPATLLKAEAIVPTAFVPAYFGADEGEGFEPGCHLVYNNSLMVAGWVALAEGSAALPAAILASGAVIPTGANWLSYARCHDDIGWGNVADDLAAIDPSSIERLARAASMLHGANGWSRGQGFQCDGGSIHGTNGTLASLAGLEAATTAAETENALRRIALLHALAIASGGLATIFMGDEIGLLNDESYLADPARRHDGRWVHRPVFPSYAPTTPSARRIAADLAALGAARIAAKGSGAPVLVPIDDHRLLALRCGTDLVFLNFSDADILLPRTGPDRLTGAPSDRLGAWQVAWFADDAP